MRQPSYEGEHKAGFDPLHPYFQAIKQLKDSIDDCASKGRVLSCLTLLYSAIDVLASLEKLPNEGTQSAFVRWVDRYMLPNAAFQFSSRDLYAARCGIVHAFSAESNLSRMGRAKKIVYAWGTANVDTLRQAGQALGRTEVSVHVRDLIDGFGIAVINYIEDVVKDADRRKRFVESTGCWLVGIDPSAFDELTAVYSAASSGN